MKKPSLIITLDIILILVLLTVQAVVSNRLTVGGVLLEKIERESHVYQTENAILREKVALNSAFTQIAEKAKKLGFAENKTVFVLTRSLPLAAKP